jgi:PAS domain S-box-containing protein
MTTSQKTGADSPFGYFQDHVRLVIDTIPGFVWSAGPDGAIEYLNQRGLDYTGLSLEQIRGWNWKDTNILHPEDLHGLFESWNSIVASGGPGEIQARMRRYDGEYRWFLFRVAPLRDAGGNLVAWWGIDVEIHERKNAEMLLEGENNLLEMIATGTPLSQVLDSLCRLIEETNPGTHCSVLLVDPDRNQFKNGAAPTLPHQLIETVHGMPVDPPWGPCAMAVTLKQPVLVSDIASEAQKEFCEWRNLAIKLELKSCWSSPILSSAKEALGAFAIYFPEPIAPSPKYQKLIDQFAHVAAVAIEAKRAEDGLRRSQAYLSEAQKLSRTGSFGWTLPTGRLVWSPETFRILDYDDTVTPSLERVFDRVHPEDLAEFKEILERASRDRTDLDHEHRLLMPDGTIKHVHVLAHAVMADGGDFEFVGAVSDITEAKLAEETIRQDERELRGIVEAIPQLITVLAPSGDIVYVNKPVLDFTGLSLDEIRAGALSDRVIHPDDRETVSPRIPHALQQGESFECEYRLLGKDGKYRWFINRFNPLANDGGQVVRWYVTGIDIDHRKQTEDRIKNENIALREDIDRVSMFEEIVGSSDALRAVLTQVAKVAPMDSTVLVLGETGTGKELIARAIHKRSNRSARPFIRVNCAAIPQSLIASELFGHEKGSFTGALQRRLGRFESADGGTIFLDEIGELPMEAQVSLLRVLQEREFERVGSSQPISVDVRVVAATNRNLRLAVEAGSFRQDLFYRLNVFPIRVPALRERADDIPLLVEYLIERYGKKAGKRIRNVSKRTLELFQSYDWPGNVRELQNVIERAVILSDGETFSVDETWLKHAPSTGTSQLSIPLRGVGRLDPNQERELIEAALAESGGRIAGPLGAAAKLRVPRQTLESKITSLGINKHRFRSP